MNLKNVGNNIKNLRIRKGLTQLKLAEIVEISTVHMSHIETGSVCMSLETLINISNALETTPDSILLGEYKMINDGNSNPLSAIFDGLSSEDTKLLIGISQLIKGSKCNE